MQEQGIEVLADVVLNHMMGADGTEKILVEETARDNREKARPEHAVTFVGNHDTQPGQALYSFIPQWFKPLAYALILLRKDGIPCVFYGDFYGIPHDKIPPVTGLKKFLKLRECYAYGEQTDYFDDPSLVGFTRTGDWVTLQTR